MCLTRNGDVFHWEWRCASLGMNILTESADSLYYLLTNWFAYLYGRIQSPRPDVMPDRRKGITKATGFVFACIYIYI